MGNSRSALKMIMEELHDVDKAIEFAKEQDDGELWEDLILYSIDKPRKWDSFWEALHVWNADAIKGLNYSRVLEKAFTCGHGGVLVCEAQHSWPTVHKNLQ